MPQHYAKINFRWHVKNSAMAGNIRLVSTDGTIYAGGCLMLPANKDGTNGTEKVYFTPQPMGVGTHHPPTYENEFFTP
jgi:hypothetical protein